MHRSRSLIALLVIAVIGAVWMVTIGAEPDNAGEGTESPAAASKRTRRRGPRPEDAATEKLVDPPAASDDDLVLAGRVVTGEDRAPVPGARVDVFPMQLSSGAERSLHEHGQLRRAGEGFPQSPAAGAAAGADGRFEVRTQRAGLHHVLVSADGFAPRAAYRRTGADEWDIVLAREQGVRLRTVDLLGVAVAGASLHIRSGDSSAPVAAAASRTDQYGRAALRLGVGDRVIVRASGFSPITWQPEDLSTAERVLTLEPGRSLRGRVVDSDGRAVPDAVVRLQQAPEVPPRITDAAGEFVFDRMVSMIASSFATVDVTAQGFHPGSGTAEEAGKPVLVRLSRPVRITGRIVDADGRPFAESELTWEGVPRTWVRRQGDAEGRFALDAPARTSGKLTVQATREDPEQGHLLRWKGVEEIVLADSDVSVDVVLERSEHAYLVLRALTPDGAPLPDVGIVLRRRSSVVGPAARTDADGYARIVLADPTKPLFRVELELPDGLGQPKDPWVPVSDAPDSPATDLVVRPATQVTLVFVRPGGAPIDGVEWQRRHPEGAGDDVRVEDGVLLRIVHLAVPERVSGVIPGIGRYSVDVDPAGVPEGRLMVPIARGATISGRVTVEGGGVPEGRLSLSVVAPEDDDWRDVDQRIGGDGRFELTGLPAGTYSLMVLTPDTTILAIRTGTIEHGQTLDLGQVSADPSQWVTVQLLDVDGKPAAGANVNYVYSPRWESLGWEVANERGEVRGPPAPGSRLVLCVDAGERGAALVHTTDDFPRRRIRLVPPTVLNVRVDGTAEFDQWVEVHVRPPGLGAWIDHERVVWPEDNGGVTRISALAPCDVRVRIHYRDDEDVEWLAERELTVGAGQRKDLTLVPARVDDED